MALDKIPEINWDVLETHYHDRYESPEKFQRFQEELNEHLEKNPALESIIHTIASKSYDSNSVYQMAALLLDVVNAQFEVNELNEGGRLIFNRRAR